MMLFRRYTSLLISTSIFVQSVSPAFSMDPDLVAPTVRITPKKSLLEGDETTEPSLQQIKITKIRNISEMDETTGMVVQPGDLVFFDIDDTLLKRGKDSNEDILNLDPKVVEMVKNWQALNAAEPNNPEKHITLILLTARKFKNEEKTREQFKKIGFPENIEIIFAPNDRQTAGEIPTKGRYAIKRIHEAKIKPRRIIVIDDLEKNLKDIYQTFQQDNTYKNIPLKLLQRKTQTKIYESPDSKVSFPKKLTDLTYVRHLAGGSGGVHVLKNKEGQLFTFKSAGNSEQMKEEILADALYRSLEVNVPAFAIYDHLPAIEEVKKACTGPGPYRLSPFLEADETASDEVRAQAMGKHFVADALLSNFDIVIDRFKNVLMDKGGTLWRIDNGGSLRFRALGESKFGLENWDAHEVKELESMRNVKHNAEGAQVYRSLTENDLKGQVQEILKKSPQLFNTLDDIAKKLHLTNPGEVREMLRRRLDDLANKYFLTPSSSSSQIFDGFEAPSFGAGILPYSIDPITKKKVILLGKRKGHNWWCNPGGKSDLDKGSDSDKTLGHTAVRETQEESLGNLSFTPQELSQVPSHAIINRGGVFYRMYVAPHPYVPVEKLKNAPAVEAYGWFPEYTDYRWAPLDEFLLGIKQNHLVEEESKKTIKIGDMIIYPSFFEMLSEAPVKATLKNIRDGKKVRAKHTHEEGVLRIYTPLSLEDEKHQLAETVIKKGLVLGQIKAKAAPTQEGIEHTEDVQKMAGFLLDSEAHALREQLLKTPYTQTQAHLREVMGKEVFESLQGNSEKEVNVFLKNHSQFEDQRQEFLSDSHYVNVLSQALDKEKKNKDKAVFYTATDSLTCFLWDIFSAHRSQLQNRGANALIAMRGLEKKFASILDVDAFIETYKQKAGKVDNGATVNDIHYADLGLSVNPFLFGNDGNSTSATYSLFYNVKSVAPTNQEQLFNAFMSTTGIPGKFKDYKALFQQYYLCDNKDNSKLFQISVDLQIVDSVDYMAVSGGDVITVKMDDESHYHGFAKILPELCTTPEKFDERIGGRLSGKLAIARTLNNLQGRLFLKPGVFLDPKYVNIKTYWRHAVSERMEASYNQKLNAQVSQDLSPFLTQHCYLDDKTFVEGTPALKKSYQYAYEGEMGLSYMEKSPKSLLPLAIKSGNTQLLKDLLEKNQDIDINARFQNVTYRGKTAATTLSALGLLTIDTPNFSETVNILAKKGLKTFNNPDVSGELQSKLLNELLPQRESLEGELRTSFSCLWDKEKQKPLAELIELAKKGHLNLSSGIFNDFEELNIELYSTAFPDLITTLKNNKSIRTLKMRQPLLLSFLNLLVCETEKWYRQTPWYQAIAEDLCANGKDYISTTHQLSPLMNFIISSEEEIYKQTPWFKEVWNTIIEAPDNLADYAAKIQHNATLRYILAHTPKEIKWPYLEGSSLSQLLKTFEDNIPFKNKSLNLSNAFFLNNIQPLVTFLEKNTTVTALNLTNCMFPSHYEHGLAEGLKKNKTLENLTLSKKDTLNLLSVLALDESESFRQAPWFKGVWNECISSPAEIIQAALVNKLWTSISNIIKNLKTDELDLTSFYLPQYMNEQRPLLEQALLEGLKSNPRIKELKLSSDIMNNLVISLMSSSSGPFTSAPWFKGVWDECMSYPSAIIQTALDNEHWNSISNILREVKTDTLDLSSVYISRSQKEKQPLLEQALLEGLKNNSNLKEFELSYGLGLSCGIKQNLVRNLMHSSPGAFSNAPWFIEEKQRITEDDS